MRRAVVLAAYTGLTSAAAAQSLQVRLTFDKSSLSIGETATATVSAWFTGHPAGAYLSSVNVDLVASLDCGVSNIAPIAWNNPALGFDGQGVAGPGGDVLGVEGSQFSLIPPVTAGSPILITTFTVEAMHVGQLEYSVRAANDAPFMFSVTGGSFADPVVGYGAEVFSSGYINIPSPGAAVVAAGGLLLGGWRRRNQI